MMYGDAAWQLEVFWYCFAYASQMVKRQTYVPPGVRRSVF
jgi:hypothetical protein